ncbi:MAG: hypothetical protein IPK07_06225 [Deltaproteobacteria bacterium]|nr:hypothetical protein [Deltaproteobacteria bacterium]
MDPNELTLLVQRDREAARRLIDGLSLDEAAPVLAQLPSRELWQLIFLARNPTGLVRTLPRTTFFTLFHEVGPADSVELLPLATPRQVEFCLDLECWRRDELATNRADEWIHRLREAGPRTLARHLAQLDFEFLIALFAGRVRVMKRNEDVDPVELDDPSLSTFDDLYYFSFAEDVEANVALELTQTLKVLRDRTPELTVDLFEALRQDLPAEVVEEARRLRDGRLADEGFPDFDRALETLARLEVERFDLERHRKLDPGSIGASTTGSELVPVVNAEASFLVAALGALEAGVRAGVERELAFLTNAVLVATVRDFADMSEVHRQAVGTVSCLGLGLERLARGDVASAAELLREVRLEAIHRVGRTLVTDLVTRVTRLRRETPLAAFGGRATILGHVVARTMDTLGATPPSYPQALDVEGETGVRAFESLADLERVDAVLTRGEALAVFLFHRLMPDPHEWQGMDLEGCTVDRLTDLSAHQLVATMLANVLLAREARFEPIPVECLADLGERVAAVLRPTAASGALASAVEQWLEPLLDGLPLAVTGVVRRVVEECREALVTQLGAFPSESTVDPLAVPIVVVRAPELIARTERDLPAM